MLLSQLRIPGSNDPLPLSQELPALRQPTLFLATLLHRGRILSRKTKTSHLQVALTPFRVAQQQSEVSRSLGWCRLIEGKLRMFVEFQCNSINRLLSGKKRYSARVKLAKYTVL